MSQTEKKALWDELKDAGVTFQKHYRDYTTAELETAVDHLRERQEELRARSGPAETISFPKELSGTPEHVRNTHPPLRSERDEVAGLRLNTQSEEEPIRVDEQGLVWYQDEVRKPSMPKPRGRRVLRYVDPGVRTGQVQNGEFNETFEMPGSESRQAEARITLPSYQVGIYRDPRFPFKIHVYNESRGFDLFEVQDFYGGAELVPAAIKRIYVSSTLCYDIRTTIREIEAEARELRLKKEGF